MSLVTETYEEMRSKWGFQDGEQTPDGVEAARQALIQIINAHLPGPIKAKAFDRPGFHNAVMIRYFNEKTGGEEWDDPYIKEPEGVNEILINAEENGEIEIYPTLKVKVKPIKKGGGKR